MSTHRYARANNKYLEDFNPEEASSHIIYLDDTNLYGWAMSQPLSMSDFQWMETREHFKVEDVADDILDMDLENPSSSTISTMTTL